jgi:hypothetical protein
MMRRFDFEADVYESLSCVPMVVRRKLDRLGIKIGLEQWQKLGRGERLMICHAPADQPEECDALKLFIHEAALARSGTPPRPLSEDGRRHADPPVEPPSLLVSNARRLGVNLTAGEWERLNDDERYALIKLGGDLRPSHNFEAALNELLADGRADPLSDK